MPRQTACHYCGHKILASHESRWEHFYTVDGVERKLVFCRNCFKPAATAWRNFACNPDESAGMAELEK